MKMILTKKKEFLITNKAIHKTTRKNLIQKMNFFKKWLISSKMTKILIRKLERLLKNYLNKTKTLKEIL